MSSPAPSSAEKQISELPQQAISTTQKKKDIRASAAAAAMATIQDDDERLLTRIGYRQVNPTV